MKNIIFIKYIFLIGFSLGFNQMSLCQTEITYNKDGNKKKEGGYLEYENELINIGSSKTEWKAKWISSKKHVSDSSSWICYRKEIFINFVPEPTIINIAVDSKYWLWINGKLVIYEGGLKRTPSPIDTYYDEVDISKFLKKGRNIIAVLVWFFGQDGFSHNNSGLSGLVFECQTNEFEILSDKTWKIMKHPAYSVSQIKTNRFLAESNFIFNAIHNIPDWFSLSYNDAEWDNAIEIGMPPITPWNRLIKRPIPQFKDFGLKNYEKISKTGDTVIAFLPYNAQISPYFKIKADERQNIKIFTDNSLMTQSIKTEYITKEGTQDYECLAWMNGHEVRYIIPEGIKLISLKYRETGYDTELSGSFSCNDEFLNKLWKKAQRTLYLNMRDSYMDCPDRERAQWWGDEVLEIGQAFYALDTNAIALARKGITELINWRTVDSVLYSPINGDIIRELPLQMLASISIYGIWTYFQYSADTSTLRNAFPYVKNYLEKWEIGKNGLVKRREGDWFWIDWEENIDTVLLENTWYTLALQGVRNMAETIGEKEYCVDLEQRIDCINKNSNYKFWDGLCYSSEGFKGEVDERGNALAVLAGIADSSKFDAITNVILNNRNASPYMEKYVLEALFKMDKADIAIKRMKSRYHKMNNSFYSTLWERWELKRATNNHAMSGGPLTLLSQYVAGIEPVKAGYETYHIYPQMGQLLNINSCTNTIKGNIILKMKKRKNTFIMNLNSPKDTRVYLGIPKMDYSYKKIKINNKTVWNIEKNNEIIHNEKFLEETKKYYIFCLEPGVWEIRAE